MKLLISIFAWAFLCCSAGRSKDAQYTGSTPAHMNVREFLNISLTDSIDFIRWNLVLHEGSYDLDCHYGLGRAGTNGFINGQHIRFSGQLEKAGHYYHLKRGNKIFYIREINFNLLYLLDKNKSLLVGNGGFSYVLNNLVPKRSDQFNHPTKQGHPEYISTFQGRTPCQELSALMGRQSSAACNKMKWYLAFFSDSITGKPTYYLKGGSRFKREAMEKGSWEIMEKNGRIIYKLEPGKNLKPLYLLKADDNILFFTDAEGNLLVGNEDFSYTLNRTENYKG